MRRRVTPLRYFLAVQPPSREMLVAWGLVVAFALWQLHVGDQDTGERLALVLFVQIFGASAGYRDRLLRGHFDPILTGPRGRWSIAAAHWAIAALPGIIVWAGLALVEWIGQMGRAPSVAAPEAVVALLCASTLSWAISVPLCQYAGGTVWTAGLLLLAGGRWIGSLHLMFEHAAATWSEAGRMALAGMACPFLLTSSVARPDGRTLLVTIVLCGAAWAAGAAAIAWSDAVLEDTNR